MRHHVTVAYGAQHVGVVVRPEVLLADDGLHEVVLGVGGRLAAPVAVEDPEVRVLQVALVLGLLVRDGELVFHVQPAALAVVAGDAHVHAYGGRHRGGEGRSSSTL